MVRGSAYPFQQHSTQLSKPDDAQPEHIFLSWREAGADKTILINLWPYVQLRWQSELHRSVVCVVSHYYDKHKKRTWYEINLQNGRQQTFQPTEEEAKILCG